MTPTQLRAFATVVRLGSVKAAAADIGVTEAAVSLHVGQLRKELGDQLFNRTASGLAFTPGGLRLASRAVEMLGLQDRTVLEVREAGAGRRMLRLGTSALFAEYAAPGLISLFAERAKDLDVELSVHPTAAVRAAAGDPHRRRHDRPASGALGLLHRQHAVPQLRGDRGGGAGPPLRRRANRACRCSATRPGCSARPPPRSPAWSRA